MTRRREEVTRTVTCLSSISYCDLPKTGNSSSYSFYHRRTQETAVMSEGGVGGILPRPNPRDPKLWATTRPAWAPPVDTTDDEDTSLPPRPLPNSYWATPTLLASEYPGGPTAEIAERRLKALLEVGVVDFLDLTTVDDGLEEYVTSLKGLVPSGGEVLEGDDWSASVPLTTIRYGRFSIRDRGIPTPGTLQRILSALSASQGANRKAVVHCWGGIGRTGTVVGCWLVHAGVARDEEEYDGHQFGGRVIMRKTAGEVALDMLEAKWKGVDKSWRAPNTPETDRQVEVVKTFRPSLAEEEV